MCRNALALDSGSKNSIDYASVLDSCLPFGFGVNRADDFCPRNELCGLVFGLITSSKVAELRQFFRNGYD